MKQYIALLLSDYGGVISYPQDPERIQVMCKILNSTEKDFEKRYWAYRHEYDQGLISSSEYWMKSFPAIKDHVISDLIQLDAESWSNINMDVIHWFEELQEMGLEIAIFSNMPKDIADFIKSHRSVISRIPKQVFSYEIKKIKPHLDSYQEALSILEINPEMVLFLDDKIENIHGAQLAQVHGHHFHDLHEARTTIEANYVWEAIVKNSSKKKKKQKKNSSVNKTVRSSEEKRLNIDTSLS